MRRFLGLESFDPAGLSRPIVTWGIFDGVHRGHQKLLAELAAWARQAGGQAVVLTFDPHPRSVLEHRAVPFLTSLEHRLLLLERNGADATLVVNFNRAFANQSAEEFFRAQLVGRLGVRCILLGESASFGKGRLGNPDVLREVAAGVGVEVRTSAPLLADGAVVSSTAIRRELELGNLGRAAAMLGRPVAVLGTVVRGAGRGRTLGFPTANLDLHHEARPPVGVYGTRTRLRTPEDARIFLSLTNIGTCPTFDRGGGGRGGGGGGGGGGRPTERVEVHLLDFEGSLYGQDLEVEFLFKIRDERRFDGPSSLVAQLERDRAFLLERATKPVGPLAPPVG